MTARHRRGVGGGEPSARNQDLYRDGAVQRSATNVFRGSAPVDALERLAEVVCRASEVAADQVERFAERDINALICAGEAR